MKKWTMVCLLPLLLIACKSRKKQLTDEEGVTIGDFISFFDESATPVSVADSSLDRRKADTAFIPYKTFTRFVPDSLLAPVFGKNGKPHIYPVARINSKNTGTYLLMKAVTNSQKAAYLLVFNKNSAFVAGMPVLVQDADNATNQSAVIDNRFSVTTNSQRKTPEGKTLYRKAAYAYIDGTNTFALILTETNETETKAALINPIDTVSRKNKLSGDYLQNKRNLVSVRDSRKAGQILFFIHFEKDNGDCRGELKGEAKMIGANKAFYRQSGDPCEMQLLFSGNNVTLKEDNCGSHRDIKCFFEGVYTRKPPAKPTKPVKSSRKA